MPKPQMRVSPYEFIDTEFYSGPQFIEPPAPGTIRPLRTIGPSEPLPPIVVPPLTAVNAIQSLGPLAGKLNAAIVAQMQAAGYSSVTGNNGGTIWTKPFPDGNTAVVRVDPAMVRVRPRGFADEVPNVHKEIVPSSKVSFGNYRPSDATKLDDCGLPSTDPGKTHIPGGH